MDFTGELNRYAIAKATIRDIDEVKKCRGIAEALMGEFLQVCRPTPVSSNILTYLYRILYYLLMKVAAITLRDPSACMCTNIDVFFWHAVRSAQWGHPKEI